MKATILLVDGDEDLRDSLGRALRSAGYDVSVASDGPEALNSLPTTGFDLVLLDLDLPIRNGWDILGQIITISLSLPLIIVTERPNKRRLAAQSGVVAVLEKPLDLPLLVGVVERALAGTSESRSNSTKPEPP
jgi:DNA-binding NtrC family response regulator